MPKSPPALDPLEALRQAVVHHRAGELEPAERLYLAVLQLAPHQGDANHNLGLLELHSGRLHAGLKRLKHALENNPACEQFWLSYADALAQAGDPDANGQLLQAAVQYGHPPQMLDALRARLQPTPSTPPARDVEALTAAFHAGAYAQAESLAKGMTDAFSGYVPGWKLRAASVRQQGRNDEALHLLQHAAMLAPLDAELFCNLGNTLKAMHRLQDAESQYRKALRIHPAFFEAHINLGNTLRELGRLQEAQASYRAALTLRPDNAVAHNNLGLALHDLGQWTQSEASCRQALALQPDFAEAHNNLGLVLRDLGRLDEAKASCLRALALKADYASAHNNLGNILKDLKQPGQAEASYRRALACKPDYAEACNNLGSVLHELQRQGEAEAAFRQALRIRPGYTSALSNLGAILHDMGRSAEALDCHRQALQSQPAHAESHNNLGILLNDLGRRDEALSSYTQALQINPHYADTHNNLGVLLNDVGRPEEAMASFRQALQIRPEYAEAHNNLGAALKDLGRLDEALECFQQALRIKPDYAEAFDNLLFVLNYHPDKSAGEVFTAYADYDARFGQPQQRMLYNVKAAPPQAPRRLRIGYVSPDFRQHSCMYFMEPLLARHDRQAVEVFAYAELAAQDATTARYRTLVDHWVSTRGLSDEALAQRIQDDGIDILVDLAGHTRGNRLRMFARKPAPVAVSWLGFGGTTGLKAIDYFLTDAQVAPPGCEPLFSEQPWRLDGPALVYRPAPGMGEAGPLPALARGHVSFGTLTRAVRINHRTVRVWADILNRVPGARLIVNSGDFRNSQNQDGLARQFALHGISRDRLEIGYQSPAWDVLRETDISLDCFPHNSGTTLFESLYMGVPFVTLAGHPGIGRLGSAILHGAGHAEWVADTETAYVDKAVALARDLPRLATLRANLRDDMACGALMDEAGFARRVEEAYRQMWTLHSARAA